MKQLDLYSKADPEMYQISLKKRELLEQIWALDTGGKKITGPTDIIPLLAEWADKEKEHFIVCSLNGAHEVIDIEVITVGLVNRSLVHPREVFRTAIKNNAASVIIAHNHPSGNLDPSKEDEEVTIRLKQAGEIIGIPVMDHVIISVRGYLSFLESRGGL